MLFLSRAQKRTTQPPSESGAPPDLEKEGDRQFENEECNESPYLSKEDLAPSYIRRYESGSNHPVCALQLQLACELNFSSPNSSLVMERSSFLASPCYQKHPNGKE